MDYILYINLFKYQYLINLLFIKILLKVVYRKIELKTSIISIFNNYTWYIIKIK